MSYEPDIFTAPTGWRAFKLNAQYRLRVLRWQLLSVICGWTGHALESYKGGVYFDRHGRMRDKYYARCTRCGLDSAAVWEESRLERLDTRWRDVKRDVRYWWRTDCDDCKRPAIRWGREVGQHQDCDQIPF